MKSILKQAVVGLLALVLTVPAAFAQDRVPFRQEELDQMLAPIALYPDSLLSQILMASTYPLEVVQAARWSRANSGTRGQDAVRAVDAKDWDPSVKSLTAFPQILTMMDEKIEWTERLGEAFLAQQADVMDSVQGLRRRAEAAGNLRSNEQMRVDRQGDQYYIEQASPETVYVPYYNPTVVYGGWWWPAYPPVYWAPSPAFYVVPAFRPAFIWGPAIVVSTGFFFGRCDWHNRNVTVVHNQVTVNRTTIINQPAKRVVWEHNPVHRRGVPFRNPEARKQYEHSRVAGDARRDADRRDGARTERHTDDRRTTDQRQHRLEERKSAPQDRRGDGRDDRRQSAGGRNDDNASRERVANRNNDRMRPSTQPESRQAQPETRRLQPERNARPERTMQQLDDRRGERRDGPRPRDTDSRQSATAPVTRPDSRPAAPTPHVRVQPQAEQRPAAPAAYNHMQPRWAPNGDRRAEVRNDGGRGPQHSPVRETALAPRASVSGGGHAPWQASGIHRGSGQQQHSMAQRIR